MAYKVISSAIVMSGIKKIYQFPNLMDEHINPCNCDNLQDKY